MNIIESKIMRTTVVRRIEIDRESLLTLLTPCGDIPENAAIYVNVPGGGDWSNMALDINKRVPIIVSWTEITDSEDV